MKKEYINPSLLVEVIKIEDVILVSMIEENQDINNAPYDDNF